MPKRSRLQKRLVRCLTLEIRQFHRGKHDIKNCPVFWCRTFCRFWREVPVDTKDPRWDVLLHELKGLRLLSQLLNRKRYW